MTGVVLVALLVTTGTTLVAGGLLVVDGRTRVAGLAALGVAATLGAAVVGGVRGDDEAARSLITLAAQLAVLALALYPQRDLRGPVALASVTITACVPLVFLVGLLVRGEADTWGEGLATISVITLIIDTWWRLERSDRSARWTLTWMTLSAGVALFVSTAAVFVAPTAAGAVVACLTFALVGPALVVGVNRPQLVDVRMLVVRAVVLLTTLVAFVALVTMVVSVLELVGYDDLSTGSYALIGALSATTFHPLQLMLRGVVDELLFGRRRDPLDAATHVVDQVGDDPVLALRALREALALPFAALRIASVDVAVSGVEVTHTRSIPLAMGPGAAAELVVGLRAGELRLGAGGDEVLQLVAPLMAQALRSSALAAELQVSRENAITAIEDERRRLRRDLHDGLGPRLSGIAFTSDAVRNVLERDPARALDLLTSLRAETVAAIDEIRRLVYGMRPPALDELGLVAAVRQQTLALQKPDGSPLRVTLDAADLPDLAAAVEVAAYRIIVEALTNAARHSGSDAADASLRVDADHLVVEVTDRGTDARAWTPGVGLASMQERAAELGGTLVTEQLPGGARVRAVLPLL